MENIKQNKNKLMKFNVLLRTIFFWCLAALLVFILYEFLISCLLKLGVLNKGLLSECSAPLFYIMLFIYTGMIFAVVKKGEIFKDISTLYNIKKCPFNTILKHTITGLARGVLCVFIVFILYLYILVSYLASVLALRPMYGNYLYLEIAILLLIFLLSISTSIKEGIKDEIEV